MEVIDVDEAIISVCYYFLSKGVSPEQVKYALDDRGIDVETISYSKEITNAEKIELQRVFY